MINTALLRTAIQENVKLTLEEDIGTGDITAQLIPDDRQAAARVLSREPMILAGRPWVDEILRQGAPDVRADWLADEGDTVAKDEVFLKLEGNARQLLTVERPILNFIQTLSGVATKVRHYVEILEGYNTRILDTRKTLPGLRLAQKYAVVQGGGQNHRLGLYDGFLIKENHIQAAGGIAHAIQQAHEIAPGKLVEVEVENFAELTQALDSQADIIMLDNFSLTDMAEAVKRVAGRAKLEASGNITLDNLKEVAATGVDYISMGTLTKDVKAIDLSMRLYNP